MCRATCRHRSPRHPCAAAPPALAPTLAVAPAPPSGLTCAPLLPAVGRRASPWPSARPGRCRRERHAVAQLVESPGQAALVIPPVSPARCFLTAAKRTERSLSSSEACGAQPQPREPASGCPEDGGVSYPFQPPGGALSAARCSTRSTCRCASLCRMAWTGSVRADGRRWRWRPTFLAHTPAGSIGLASTRLTISSQSAAAGGGGQPATL